MRIEIRISTFIDITQRQIGKIIFGANLITNSIHTPTIKILFVDVDIYDVIKQKGLFDIPYNIQLHLNIQNCEVNFL